MYVTPAQLADLPMAQELAQIATASHDAVVDSALMQATLRDEDRSAFDPAAVAAADDALARINESIAEACDTIDGYLGRRLPTPWPWPSLTLTRLARAIVRYDLHKDLIAEAKDNPVVRDYTDALDTLGAIRDGTITLGSNDPLNAAAMPNSDGVGEVNIDPGSKMFGRGQRAYCP